MKCIFCMREMNGNDFTEEHIFPESIGGSLCIKSVCKACNDYLGHTIDNHLCDHVFVQFERLIHKIPGKSGKIPNPLQRGILADGSDSKTIYTINEQGKPEGIHLCPRVTRSRTAEGKETISISVDGRDKDKVPQILKKIADRSGGTLNHSAYSFEERFIPKPTVNHSFQIDTQTYKRAFLKIAYELAWYWLGSDYLEDPTATIIRSCIMDTSIKKGEDWSEKHQIKGDVGLLSPDTDSFPWWRSENNPHIAFMIPVGNFIGCYVRIFNRLDGMITVTENPSKFAEFKPMFIAIDPVTGHRRESFFYEEVRRIGMDNDRQQRVQMFD